MLPVLVSTLTHCVEEGAGKATGRPEATAADQPEAPRDTDEDADQGLGEDQKTDDDEAATGDLKKREGRRERITFRGSRGDKVPGYLWLPEGRQRHPVVLVMYGIQGDKDDDSVRLVAEFLNRKGFAAMTLDWPGTGERGDLGTQDRIVDPSVMAWTVEDYGAAVKYLKGRDEIDDDRIGFAGASMGAMTGLVFASLDKRVKAVVAIVPIPNPLWGSNDPTARIRAVAPRPVLCVHTQDNADFSGVVCDNVGSNGTKKAFAGDHELVDFRDQVAEDAAAFFVKHL